MSVIRLTTCSNIVDANMVKHTLENEGIECFFTNDNFTNLVPGCSGLLGAGIQIMIEEKDFDKAIKLINTEEDSAIIKCPNCHSENVSFGLGRNGVKKVFFAFLSAITTTPMGNIENTYYCKNCKQDFKGSAEATH